MGNFKDFLKALPSTTFSHCKRSASGAASTSVTIPNCILTALQANGGVVGRPGRSAKQAWEDFVVETTGYVLDSNRSVTSQVSSVLDFWFVKDSDEWSKSPITRVCEGKSPVRYFYAEVEDISQGIRCAPRPGRGDSAPVRELTAALSQLDAVEKMGVAIDPKLRQEKVAALEAAKAAAPVRASSQAAAQDARISQLESMLAALIASQSPVKPV